MHIYSYYADNCVGLSQYSDRCRAESEYGPWKCAVFTIRTSALAVLQCIDVKKTHHRWSSTASQGRRGDNHRKALINSNTEGGGIALSLSPLSSTYPYPPPTPAWWHVLIPQSDLSVLFWGPDPAAFGNVNFSCLLVAIRPRTAVCVCACVLERGNEKGKCAKCLHLARCGLLPLSNKTSPDFTLAVGRVFYNWHPSQHKKKTGL